MTLPSSPPELYLQNIHLPFFYFPVYLPLLCPYLTCSPVLYSLAHFEPLSLSSCHPGKQNTVAMETAYREEREAAYETSSVETEAYIWPFPVCGLGGGFKPSMNIVPLFPVWETTRQMEWQTEWERERGTMKGNDRRRDVCSLLWFILTIRSGRNCLVIDRPVLSLLHNNIHYSWLYTSTLSLWLWLTPLKNTQRNPLHHGYSRCSSKPWGQHSAAEYWSAHEYELNRMSVIDLKRGASSLEQMMVDDGGSYFGVRGC